MENDLGCFFNPINQLNKSSYQCVYSDVLTSGTCFNFCNKNGMTAPEN